MIKEQLNEYTKVQAELRLKRAIREYLRAGFAPSELPQHVYRIATETIATFEKLDAKLQR
jgi:hypothetical protein